MPGPVPVHALHELELEGGTAARARNLRSLELRAVSGFRVKLELELVTLNFGL